MLEQFRSLSHEATVLETNNNCLETQLIETKSELSKALCGIEDLKNKLEIKETMIQDYECQVRK